MAFVLPDFSEVMFVFFEIQLFSSSKDSLNEVVRQVTEQTRAEISAAFGPDTAALLGTGLFFKGLGIARNMPSFKKVYYLCFLRAINKLSNCILS